MATLLRSVGRQGRALQTLVNNKSFRSLIFPLLKHKASISTSEKKKDVGAVVQPMEKSEELKKLTEKFKDTSDTEENYVSYGYEPGNRDKDWFLYHMIMFACISLGVCWGGFILAYMPDYKLRDWSHREAFLELERREKEGLPLVDTDYTKIDLSSLPSDEEIGDTEIVI
ncbi:NADH dehydrogenase [ubiquinone] 1 beta subcomplex subunit 11, mitochondrial [Biomphalaria glabrata]|nr:NADH dehydrogenase [ubiquinone] 1 beta subcomplex subunit 11, mitochondrial [Biomphalaria glabrata]